MNILGLNIQEVISLGKRKYWLILKIDGKPFLDKSNTTVFNELENSLNKNGDFLIFTCSCGIADCGGWEKVKVDHIDEKVIWTFKHNFDFTFEFDLISYKSEIEKVRSEIVKNKIVLEPEFVLYPEC